MIQSPRLPPPYRLLTLAPDTESGSQARRLAREGADDGTLLWSPREEALDCALILRPQDAVERAVLVMYVAMLGMTEALGIVMPPMTEVTYTWPNQIDANYARVGAIEIDLPEEIVPGSVPDWLILYAKVAVGPLPPETWVQNSGVTSLRDEGLADLAPSDLLETFARHFLSWSYRWHDEGFDPVRAMWLINAPSHGKEIDIEVGGVQLRGVFSSIDDDGALVLESDGTSRRVDLCGVLFGSSC